MKDNKDADIFYGNDNGKVNSRGTRFIMMVITISIVMVMSQMQLFIILSITYLRNKHFQISIHDHFSSNH